MACRSLGPIGFIRAKLGRCARCLRLSFALALAAVSLATMVPGMRGSPLSVIALALSVWWLAHITTFAMHRVIEYAVMKRLRNKPRELSAMMSLFLRGLFQATVVSMPRWLTVHLLGIAQAKPDCNCYFDDDCWFWQICDYDADCTKIRKGSSDCRQEPGRASTGSCDGVCTAGWRRGVAFSASEVAGYVERYFDVFIKAARTAPGLPTTRDIVDVDRTVADGCRSDVKRWVFGALEVVLGWDLVIGERDPSNPGAAPIDAFLAHIADVEATPAILLAARDALTSALRAEDADRVVGPIEAFWTRFPNYVPAHTGRCYPHGHDKYETGVDCHIAQLRWRVRALLSAR